MPRPARPLPPILLTALLLHVCLSFPLADDDAPPLHPLARSRECPVKLKEDRPPGGTARLIFPPHPKLPLSRDSVTPRIVNGDRAADAHLKYMVAIFRPTNNSKFQFWCTGTLIAQRWVVSAAHCGVDSSYRVLLGVKRTSDAGEREAFVTGVRQTRNHPDYISLQQGGENDIAAFELEEDTPSDRFRAMPVNVNDNIPKKGSYVRVLGYGANAAGTVSSDHELKQVDVPVNSNRQCQDAYPKIDPDSQVCAGYVGKGGCDSCQGDSGGPMMQYAKDGGPVLVGVVSSGRGCAEKGYPGVYIRVSKFEQFLTDSGAGYTKSSETKAVFDNGLGAGAIGGISAAAVVIFVALLVTSVILIRKKRRGGPSATAGSVQTAPVGESAGGMPNLPPYSGSPPPPGSSAASSGYVPAPATPPFTPAPGPSVQTTPPTRYSPLQGYEASPQAQTPPQAGGAPRAAYGGGVPTGPITPRQQEQNYSTTPGAGYSGDAAYGEMTGYGGYPAGEASAPAPTPPPERADQDNGPPPSYYT